MRLVVPTRKVIQTMIFMRKESGKSQRVLTSFLEGALSRCFCFDFMGSDESGCCFALGAAFALLSFAKGFVLIAFVRNPFVLLLFRSRFTLVNPKDDQHKNLSVPILSPRFNPSLNVASQYNGLGYCYLLHFLLKESICISIRRFICISIRRSPSHLFR